MLLELHSLGQKASSARSPGATRFWNFKTACLWTGVALFGGLVFMWGRSWSLVGPLGAGLAVYALYAAVVSLRGVALDDRRLTLPRSVWPWPALVLGRREISVVGVGQVTALGKFMGAELVLLSTPDGEETALFSSRAQRLAFFEAVRRLNPAIEFYRAF